MTKKLFIANPDATNSELDAKVIIKHPSLTSAQRAELIEQWVEIVVDGMDMKTLVQIVTDNMLEYYEKCSDIEVREEIDNFDEEIKNFPADNKSESARILNNALEKIIRECPEQYLWMHRRFKTRPPGEVSFY